MGRQICPSHRGLDIISLCFPQLAQPAQCKPQYCIVKQTEMSGVVVAGRRMRMSEYSGTQRGQEFICSCSLFNLNVGVVEVYAFALKGEDNSCFY